jgi:hypothetical protein
MMERKCETCAFYKKDWGLHCMIGGWTGADRDNGYCHFEVKPVYKQGSDLCHHWEKKECG